MDYSKVKNGILRQGSDDGIVADGNIAFAAGDNLTTEKLTSAFAVNGKILHNDGLYLLAIDKPTENTAGNLTVSVYNQVKVDGTNSRDCLLSTVTVEKITDAGTFRCFLLQGAFIGESTIKLGMKFATDSGAITVYYKIYRL